MKNYLIFDTLIEHYNDAPFQACKALLALLHVKHESIRNTNNDIGYDLRYKKDLQTVFQDALNTAKEKNAPIIALENSSYLGLKEAIKKANATVELVHVNDILLQYLTQKDIIHNFSNFNGAIYYGSDDENLKQEALSKLLQLTHAKEIHLNTTYAHDGFSFLEFDKNVALQMGAKIVFDAYDNSCDFLIINDIRSFNIFDTYQKQLTKAYGRPLGIGLPILSIGQVLLMALGKTKPKENLTSLHVIKPSFI